MLRTLRIGVIGCFLLSFFGQAQAADTNWHCHLLSLGVVVPEEMKPALQSLNDALHSVAADPRLETMPATDAENVLFRSFISKMHEQTRKSLKAPLIAKLDAGIATRVEHFNLRDPNLLQLMRGPSREVNEVMAAYRDILRLAESHLAYFTGTSPSKPFNYQELFAALNALAIVMNPSGPFGYAPPGSFSEVALLEDRDEDYVFVEFRKLLREVALERASIYGLLRTRGAPGPYVPRIGTLIPVERELTLYEENQTIGLPVEYVSFAKPHGSLFERFRMRLDRFLGGAHAFTSIIAASKTYGMVDLLGNYARVMKGYRSARDGLPTDYQEILDLVFSSVRFEPNQNLALGPVGIKSLLKRIGTSENPEELNDFTKRFLANMRQTGALSESLSARLETIELMSMRDQLLKHL